MVIAGQMKWYFLLKESIEITELIFLNVIIITFMIENVSLIKIISRTQSFSTSQIIHTYRTNSNTDLTAVQEKHAKV